MSSEYETQTESQRRHMISALALLAATSLIVVACPAMSQQVSADTAEYADSIDRVDGNRMLATVADLQNFGSRAYFHDSMWNASAYIFERFADLGLSVRYQDFQAAGYSQRNVVAVMEGKDPDAPQYLFGAHYDSLTLAMLGYEEGNTTSAPGADDDASGVAATIELATILHEMKFNSTIKFVAFGAEETGLNGSDAFVREELSMGVLYADTVLMDMIGYRATQQNTIFIFRDTSSNTMAESIDRSIDEYGLNLSLTLVSGKDMAWSDHYSFWNVGYPSILVIEDVTSGWPANPHYHTENDTIDHISEEQMAVVTQALLAGFLGLQTASEGSGNLTILLIASLIVIVVVATIVSVYVVQQRRRIFE